jgi:hypothetical protein
MENWLVSWIGRNDINAVQDGSSEPIASALEFNHRFTRVWLLNNFAAADAVKYRSWLSAKEALIYSAVPIPATAPT